MSSVAPPRTSTPSASLPSHWLIMAVLFIGALGVGYALLPGQVQRVAMLERDGQSQQALELLERSYADGGRDVRTLMQLQSLYEQQGELAKARTVLAQLIAKRPRDANVLKRAAVFYRMTQDDDGYIATLKAQLAVRFGEETCRELIGLLRLRSETAAEQAAIQDCRSRGYRRPDDLMRLAQLVASDGDLAQASVLLRSVDDLRRVKTERDRVFLVTTLLELDQPREAYRRALRWLRGLRDTRLALTVVTLLANANQHDIAIELAKDVSVPGDSVSLAIAELMLDRGQPVAAKAYLRGWLEKARLGSADVISRFIVATLDAEDPETAMVAARRYGLGRLNQSDLVALAEAFAATGKQAEFDAVRALIRPEELAENPLLQAAVAVERGAPEAGRSLLSTIAVDDLDEWRLSLWAKLMDRTGKTEVAAETLRQLGVDQATVPVAQPERATVEPRMIRRTKRIARTKSKRPPVARVKQAPQSAPAGPFGTGQFPSGG